MASTKPLKLRLLAAVSAGLTNDAKRHTDAAADDLAAATRQEGEAKAEHAKAHSLWAEAAKLDPEGHKKHAAPPAVAHPAPAVAAAPAPLAAVTAAAPGK